MNFKGIIFDLDGTLVNSLEDLADAMNNVLSKFNYPTHDLNAYRFFIGNGILNLVRAALPETNRDKQTIAECFNLMNEIYNNNCTNKTKPYNGIIDLLNELKSRNMKLAVFSNKADEFTKRIVQSLIPGYFDEVVGLSSEAQKKPNPSGALEISKKLEILPENMMYIGDTGIDMQTANNAGMYAVGVLWGFRTKEELINNGAKHIISHPTEVFNIL